VSRITPADLQDYLMGAAKGHENAAVAMADEIRDSWKERDRAVAEAARLRSKNERLEAVTDAAVRFVESTQTAMGPDDIKESLQSLKDQVALHGAATDADAKACVERLGIDVPKWASEIRTKVATAEERAATRQHCKVLLGCSRRRIYSSSTNDDLRLYHIVELLGIAFDRIDALEDQ